MKKFIVTEEMVAEYLVEEIKKLDWKGFSVYLKNEPDFYTSLNLIGKGAGAFGVGGTTTLEILTVEFYVKSNYENLINSKFTQFFLGDSLASKIFRKIFYRTSDPKEVFKKMVKAMVMHENRHCQQYFWMLNNQDKIDIREIMEAERNSIYGAGAMEYDANRYQSKGKDIPFEKVFKKFLKTNFALAGKPIK